jgi:hypothetical protein
MARGQSRGHRVGFARRIGCVNQTAHVVWRKRATSRLRRGIVNRSQTPSGLVDRACPFASLRVLGDGNSTLSAEFSNALGRVFCLGVLHPHAFSVPSRSYASHREGLWQGYVVGSKGQPEETPPGHDESSGRTKKRSEPALGILTVSLSCLPELLRYRRSR